ncbi:hypothetical protein [Nocardioides hwasunensis]|uniref:Integral membrane protein n=1 Tax=Nocardioides hwasunensis TaxID=397258 RepID=A0ABR8MA88_9ACTN|nr:hypothetical protein [Nocardioides hwasunensis]MBD3913078.1 hypothetical protein [Nocardioides hwasunensis]
MDLRASLLVRSVRALLLAAVVVAAGTFAHVSAAGAMPGWASMLTLYAVVAGACAVVLGGEASALRLVTLTVGGQVVVHGVLSGLGGHAAGAAMAHGPHGEMVHPGGGPSPAWLTHGIDDMVAHPVMAATHIGAAAAVALWLAVGERALWTLVRLARCSARSLLARAAVAVGLHPVVLLAGRRAVGVRRVALDPLPLLPVWSRGPARRGPPVALLPH